MKTDERKIMLILTMRIVETLAWAGLAFALAGFAASVIQYEPTGQFAAHWLKPVAIDPHGGTQAHVWASQADGVRAYERIEAHYRHGAGVGQVQGPRVTYQRTALGSPANA